MSQALRQGDETKISLSASQSHRGDELFKIVQYYKLVGICLLYFSRDFANATIATYCEAHLQSVIARSILHVALKNFVHRLQYILSWCSHNQEAQF